MWVNNVKYYSIRIGSDFRRDSVAVEMIELIGFQRDNSFRFEMNTAGDKDTD